MTDVRSTRNHWRGQIRVHKIGADAIRRFVRNQPDVTGEVKVTKSTKRGALEGVQTYCTYRYLTEFDMERHLQPGALGGAPGNEEPSNRVCDA